MGRHDQLMTWGHGTSGEQVSDIHIRPWMASHGISWVPSSHVRFGNLDFIIMMEGELAQVPAVVQPLHSAGLDAIADMLEELQLHAPEAHAPRSD